MMQCLDAPFAGSATNAVDGPLAVSNVSLLSFIPLMIPNSLQQMIGVGRKIDASPMNQQPTRNLPYLKFI